jgi:hypothetical protein
MYIFPQVCLFTLLLKMLLLLKFIYFYICPVSVYIKKPVPEGAYVVGGFSASVCSKSCDVWHLMNHQAMLTGN